VLAHAAFRTTPIAAFVTADEPPIQRWYSHNR
jgi:hypothetical protein